MHTPTRGLAAHHDELVARRRHIHAHPELGRQEFATTEFVATRLADAGLNPKVLPGGTGLTCDFGPEDRPRIALRADMDAPADGRAHRACRSPRRFPVWHTPAGTTRTPACCSAPGLALASAPELPVGVRLIFQPAEELMPGGAIDAVAAGAVAGVARIFALHCDPAPRGRARSAVRLGPITSAADSIEITLHSPGGHTSRPHLTGDLVYALGTLITGVPGVLSRRIDPRKSTVMVWGAVNAGVAANAIPQTGTLAGTIRTSSRETWLTAGIACPARLFRRYWHRWRVEYSVNYRRGVPPVVNEEVSTRILTHAIEALGPTALARHPSVRRWRGFLLVSGGSARGDGAAWACGRAGVAAGSAPAHIRPGRARAEAVGVRTMVNLIEQSARVAGGGGGGGGGAGCGTAVPECYGPDVAGRGRMRRSCTYSAGAPAISAASAITPR